MQGLKHERWAKSRLFLLSVWYLFMNIEERVPELVEGELKLLGLEIVRVRLLSAKEKVLEILIARIDGAPLSIQECTVASHHMSAVFDVEDLISDHYRLEVSSAGVERPLVKLADFEKFSGNVIDLSLYKKVEDRKRYRGILLGVHGSDILLQVDGKDINFAFEDIKTANIALTDELFRKILNNKPSVEEGNN
jgi:ribosome maturation factor RimP